MSASANWRLGVDIGGTFTDLVLADSEKLITHKLLTTRDDPANGVLQGIQYILQNAAIQPTDIKLVLHGTTLATNALIERTGARTALICTEGHRDALEMAFENRFEQYDVLIDRPTPLVPRIWRLPIRERLSSDGSVLLPLDLAAVPKLIEILARDQIESVAIGLLHSYQNDAHEQKIGEALLARMPNLSLTLSSEVCPEIREFERLSTACANAYIRPRMDRYLNSLSDQLAALGIGCSVLMMTSGGGLTNLAAARRFPIRLVESGPAGGALLASRIAQRGNNDAVLSFDMGGTTAKICLIDDGMPLLSRSFEIDRTYRFKKGSGLPVRIPVIEMMEIGAGGGSIARLDKLGRIQVGPQSAGSEPGPVAYDRGGVYPTVTDADLVLGRLDPENFAAGTLPLNFTAAAQSIHQSLAEKLTLSVAQSAAAVVEIVDENMAAAARAHAAEWGKDLGNRTLVAFGGAAPLHAAALARKLKIGRIVIPPGAGVGSAIGFLTAPVSFEVVRSRFVRLSEFDADPINVAFKDMREEALAVVKPALSGDAQRRLIEQRFGYMRYVGQGYEVAVAIPNHDLGQQDVAVLVSRFEQAYEQIYGRILPGQDVEVLSWTLMLRGPEPDDVPAISDFVNSKMDSSAANQSHVQFSDTRRAPPSAASGSIEWVDRLARQALHLEQRYDGPLLIVEPHTTTYVPSDFQIRRCATGELLMQTIGTEQ